MERTSFTGRADQASKMNYEVDRLLNMIDSRVRRKELDIAEEYAEELLHTVMTFLLREKAARMNRLNQFLVFAMKLLLLMVFTSLFCMIMDIHPFLGLKAFVAGSLMIALLIMVNHHLIGRFYQGIHLMTETYEKVSRRFIGLLLERVSVNNDPEAALNMFRLAIMR